MAENMKEKFGSAFQTRLAHERVEQMWRLSSVAQPQEVEVANPNRSLLLLGGFLNNSNPQRSHQTPRRALIASADQFSSDSLYAVQGTPEDSPRSARLYSWRLQDTRPLLHFRQQRLHKPIFRSSRQRISKHSDSNRSTTAAQSRH